MCPLPSAVREPALPTEQCSVASQQLRFAGLLEGRTRAPGRAAKGWDVPGGDYGRTAGAGPQAI